MMYKKFIKVFSHDKSASKEQIEDVDGYIKYAMPWFYILILLDLIVGKIRNNLSFEQRDTMGSLTAGSMSLLPSMMGSKNWKVVIYIGFGSKIIFELTIKSRGRLI